MTSESGKENAGLQGLFNSLAASYERKGPRFFSHFGRRLVERVNPVAGAKVLDVATGRGAVLFPAAERVGPQGAVAGIDFSSRMITETAAEVAAAAIGNVRLQQMDAEHLEFRSDSFDYVLCGLSLLFFPNPHRALRELYRVLKPGGSVGLTTFAKDSPIQQVYVPALRRHLSLPQDGTAAPPRFDTKEELRSAVSEAGFTRVVAETEDGDFVYTSEDELWEVVLASGYKRFVDQMTESAREEAKADLYERLRPLKRVDGVHAVYRVLFASGLKPK